RIGLEAEVADLQARVQQLEARAVTSRELWNTAKDGLFDSERRRDRANSAFDLLREQIALDLHAGIDALADVEPPADDDARASLDAEVLRLTEHLDRKSTRLNSSHDQISYAVFCLKKKKKIYNKPTTDHE